MTAATFGGAEHVGGLKRALSLPLVILYGVGTTVGAGIYVLVGEVAATAGMAAPLSFVLAAVLAGLSAFSFAELVSRYPRAAGEATYAMEAFQSRAFSTAVGLTMVVAGSISAATVLRGSLGYLNEFVAMPAAPTVVVFALALGAVAAWGIMQAVTVAAILTAVELAGLALAIWAGGGALANLPEVGLDLLPAPNASAVTGVLAGAVIAFFAFIGFEDIVNIAEESKDARRTLPTAIVVTLAVTTALYILVALVAVLALPLDELVASQVPLARILDRGFAGGSLVISAISIVAVVNGALVQIIMASRILYGLGDAGQIPAVFARVHPRTRTPLYATAPVTVGIALLAAAVPLVRLAEFASVAVLLVFAAVNLSLLRLKRSGRLAAGGFSVPAAVPAAGFVASGLVILFQVFMWLAP